MLVIPIRTESDISRTPFVNFGLIGANILCFAVFGASAMNPELAAFRSQYLVFHSDAPAVYQFLTYQFLHADMWHLFGNMLFLWVFGNSVNAKMGQVPYLLFYLAAGVFAAWGYGVVTTVPSQLLGASGAIAAITSAYLVLFPRSRVTVLVWFFFIHFFQVRAMIVIVLKVIVWDNIVSPALSAADAVAQSAHLWGYLFGFVGAMSMLLLRALPRDQYDILALWKRWNQRREFAATMRDPAAAATAKHGSVARTGSSDSEAIKKEEEKIDAIGELRSQISEHLDRESISDACRTYEELVALDDQHCLAERYQLKVARGYYDASRFSEAANAFERYITVYRDSIESINVRLLLGIIYARDLKQFEEADTHLTKCQERLQDASRQQQCEAWLSRVRAELGRPAV